MKTVAIIGAGITGLTAAFRLKEKGFEPVIFEAGDRVGGPIQSIRKDGFLAEFGPNTLLETSPKVTALINDLGLQNRRLYSDPRAGNRYLVRGKKPVALPGSPAAFFRSPLFSTATKLRLFAEPFIARAPKDKEESVAEFVVRRLGQEFLDYAVNPMVAGVYAGNPARLSVKQAFPKLWDVEQRYGSLILGQILGARERKRRGTVSKANAPKLSFDEGLQVLVDTLHVRLKHEIRLGAPATRIARSGGRWTVETQSDGSAPARFECDSVLLTIPAHQLARLNIQADKQLDLSSLEAIHYPPVASIVLGYRRQDVAHPLDGFGMLIPEVEHCNSLGVIFSSALFPNRAPEGHVTLTCYIGGVRAPALVDRSPEELVCLAHEDIATILGVSGKPTFQHLTIFRKAIPQYDVGYGRFKELFSETERQSPGLFFAGHYRDGISMGDSICSGNDIADRIQQFLAQ